MSDTTVAGYAIRTLAALSGKTQVWAVGERVHARLADAGLPLMGLFAVAEFRQDCNPARRADSLQFHDQMTRVRQLSVPKSVDEPGHETAGGLIEQDFVPMLGYSYIRFTAGKQDHGWCV